MSSDQSPTYFTPTENSRVRVSTIRHHDGKGRLKAYFDLDQYGQPTLNEKGFHGKYFDYDQFGRQVEVRTIGLDKNPLPSTRPNFERSNFIGDLPQTLTLTGNIDSASQIKRVHFEYNEQWLPVRVATLDENEELIRHKEQQGAAVGIIKYNEYGLLVSESFLDEHQNPMLNIMGFHEIKNVYDQRHNLTSTSYHDVDGLPVSPKDHNGIARSDYEYDDRHRLTSKKFFNKDSNPTSDSNLCFGYQFEYNPKGIIESVTCTGEKGHAKENIFNVALSRHKYNKEGLRTEVKFYDKYRDPTLNKDAIFEVRDQFDEYNRQTKRSYYDTDGEKVVGIFGHAGFRRTYNERHLEIERLYFDLDHDSPIENLVDASRIVTSYNHHGQLEWQLGYDVEGNVVARGDAGFGILNIYDDTTGKLTESTHLTIESITKMGFHVYKPVSGAEKPTR